MSFKYREKVVVEHNNRFIEGFVLSTNEDGQVYVVLAGQNEKPIMVAPAQVRLLNVQTEKLTLMPVTKRKRGRPRKGT